MLFPSFTATLTFKSGYTQITNIFAGLGVTEDVPQDFDSGTLTNTWQ